MQVFLKGQNIKNSKTHERYTKAKDAATTIAQNTQFYHTHEVPKVHPSFDHQYVKRWSY